MPIVDWRRSTAALEALARPVNAADELNEEFEGEQSVTPERNADPKDSES